MYTCVCLCVYIYIYIYVTLHDKTGARGSCPVLQIDMHKHIHMVVYSYIQYACIYTNINLVCRHYHQAIESYNRSVHLCGALDIMVKRLLLEGRKGSKSCTGFTVISTTYVSNSHNT